MTIRTIDAHVAGQPLRLVVEGFPSPRGRTMSEKRTWASRRADGIRRLLMLEPRGHADMVGAVMTEPEMPGSDAGVLFMDGDGFRAFSGHGVIAVATIALERGLLMSRETTRVVFDTPAGTVRAIVETSDGPPPRVESVSYQNVPSFVLHPGVDVLLPGRRLRADVAFGGEFFAIVDAESAGVPVDGAHLGDLRRLGMAITAALDGSMRVVHPADASVSGIAGTIFTAPAQTAGAALRNATVRAGGGVDRSPSGSGTAALMAVLDAMGLLAEDEPFVHEGLTGQLFEGRVARRTRVGELEAIVPEISGRAFITGDHVFAVSPDDPFADGFRIS